MSRAAQSDSLSLAGRARARRFRQTTLFCLCGVDMPAIGGLCRRCYRRRAHSRHRFSGFREQVLERDGERCRVCESEHRLAVHHRRPGRDEPDQLITLCARCHARIQKLLALKIWMPETLVLLWSEQHPDSPVQLQFPEERAA